jgi:dephospho-CoA kinase
MLLAGLTGGIASGKSLVAHTLRNLGARVIDADKIVHNLLEPDQEAWNEIVIYFGTGVLLPDKSIDRRKLGTIIFNDPEKRAWLNALLHPRVFDVFIRQVRNHVEHEPDAIIIFDAALLIETGFHKRMSKTIVVYAEREQQIERLLARDSFTREQALARIKSQMPLTEKRTIADYVIDNTGSRENTERQTKEVFALLKQESEMLRGDRIA